MTNAVKTRKKLIEVALPLEAINAASAREKSIRHGHPSTLHLWWARRPLAAARAVIFSQMVDDPSAVSELFPTEEAQDKERERLFKVIEKLVKWESTTNEIVLNEAREEIWKSWRRACADNAGHPRANELFNPEKLPAFHDPFCGGGALPLEAQRLGLEAHASDLNPVAVLITKAMIEIPSKFAGIPPVNPEARKDNRLLEKKWHAAEGLAEDVRYYGRWMRDEAEKRIGHLYPKVEVTEEMVKDRPDLRPLAGQKLTVIAWIWARTVKSPNPAFANVDVPLVTTFMLGTKPNRQVFVEPILDAKSYRFAVRVGNPENPDAVKRGTKSGTSGSSFLCLMSGAPMPFDYLRGEAKAGRMGMRLMATVAEGPRGRIYFSPTSEMELIARIDEPEDLPDADLPEKALGFRVQEYGMTRWRKLFTPRQLVGLSTLADLVEETRQRILSDTAGSAFDTKAYSDAVSVYLGLSVGRVSDYCSTICTWANNPQMEIVRGTFARQALPMTWDFAEANIFGLSTGSLDILINWVSKVIGRLPTCTRGFATQGDATVLASAPIDPVICTDPPYYDNIGYADLSDFFYLWLRRALRRIVPDLFTTVAVPKAEELIASPFRRGSREQAATFFIDGMTSAMRRLSQQTHPAFPLTIYYAFKQSEADDAAERGTTSTGWDTFLEAVIRAGLSITGTWPVRTERSGRSISIGTNALASSIALVCRSPGANRSIATRRQFMSALKEELPSALLYLQRGNIAPVDLAQAAIGPGMAIYTRYSKVVDAEGKALRVTEALALINQMLDEVLAEQEGDFDADTRWALAWFEQMGFENGEYGVAETLSKAKNTSISGLEHGGILKSKAGQVRLRRPDELAPDWDPVADSHVTVWEAVHYLIRALEKGGESMSAELAAVLGGMAETARELAYRLYSICERKKRAQEALSYNALVQSWPEISRLVREGARSRAEQGAMFAAE
jgi:putative DNA methylase